MKKKISFLKRLTRVENIDEYDTDLGQDDGFGGGDSQTEVEWGEQVDFEEGVSEEGELPIDMYHTGEVIVIRALVAGVRPDDLDISITRDIVTINGAREEITEVDDEFYFHRELFWGRFTRKIILPEEIIIDEAEAKEKHGLLEIVLPKLDKERSTQIKVRSQS